MRYVFFALSCISGLCSMYITMFVLMSIYVVMAVWCLEEAPERQVSPRKTNRDKENKQFEEYQFYKHISRKK